MKSMQPSRSALTHSAQRVILKYGRHRVVAAGMQVEESYEHGARNQAASFSNSPTMASPILDVETTLQPSDLMSAVRKPLASVAAMAASRRSASAPMLNE